MTDWVDIDNTTIEPDAPLISSTVFALRDNPKAIAEGAPGAPRVETPGIQDEAVTDAKLNTSATNAGRDWVLARTALASPFAVGSYAMRVAVDNNDGLVTWNAGSTVSGSSIIPGAGGTWRAMQDSRKTGADGSATNYSAGIYLRIS